MTKLKVETIKFKVEMTKLKVETIKLKVEMTKLKVETLKLRVRYEPPGLPYFSESSQLIIIQFDVCSRRSNSFHMS